MPLTDRDYITGKHPPTCTCKQCSAAKQDRLKHYTHVPFGGGDNPQLRGLNTADAEHKGLLKWEDGKYIPPEPILPAQLNNSKARKLIVSTKLSPLQAKQTRRNLMPKQPTHITHNILIGIAIVFALLTGISAMAWLLPTTFDGFGNTLIRMTGNPDIRLNITRIGNDPIPYAISFGIAALCIRWLAGKF